MNELRRMAYLDAMGIESYVSRGQLPGAAATRRLVVVRSAPGATERRPESARPEAAQVEAAGEHLAQAQAALRPSMPAVPGADAARTDRPPEAARELAAGAAIQPRFNLAAIVAGGYLWLEELADGPLATEQVQLVQSMARAVGRLVASGSTAADIGRPDVALFRWPIHNNQQLDLGEEAARSGVAGFVGRKLQEQRCRGLVLLGQSCAARVPVERVAPTALVATASTADMLANPALKRQVWADLQALTSGA